MAHMNLLSWGSMKILIWHLLHGEPCYQGQQLGVTYMSEHQCLGG